MTFSLTGESNSEVLLTLYLTAQVTRQSSRVMIFHSPTVCISTAAMAVPQAADSWPMADPSGVFTVQSPPWPVCGQLAAVGL